MRGRYKRWAKPYLDAHPEIVIQDFSDVRFFGANEIYLEIGSGKGRFLSSLSSLHPERHYLGVERDVSIIGTFAKSVVAEEKDNIRLFCGDFDIVYPLIKDLAIPEIYLNFSDPWPKKKHAKRRLTFPDRLKKIVSLITPDGRLFIKTDNDALYEFTKESAASIDLECLLDEFDYDGLDPEDAPTEYEVSFREKGLPIHRLIYRKKGDAHA